MLAFWFGRIVSCLGFILFMAGVTYACNCGTGSTCQSFSTAKAVFRGRLVKVEKEVSEKEGPVIHAVFLPNEIYKGESVGKTEKLTFVDGDCRANFEPGVEYIVFQDEVPIQSICNRTNRADMKGTKEFLARLVDRPEEAWIIAFIQGLSTEELNRSKFYVDMKRVEIEKLPPCCANLEFYTSELAKHRIKMVFPVSVTLEVVDGRVILTEAVKVTRKGGRTIVEYEVDVGTDQCDTRQILITKL